MPRKLDSRHSDFAHAMAEFLAHRRAGERDVDAQVAAILADVESRGDSALAEYTRRFDRVDLELVGLRIGPEACDAALAACDAAAIDALTLAAERIADYHARQLPADQDYRDALGIRLGARWTPLDSVGLYVPGGTAAYPSSVLMNAIPARIAGVKRIAMVVPTPDGAVNPLVLAAARIAGVTEIMRIGGAQAVAALAYGTARIAPVDKIVGPGNIWVATAKKQVFGRVGIDMIAGPSEVVVVADAENDPAWIAADLLSQAEHDAAAQAVLVADDDDFVAAVERAVASHLEILPRAAMARASWDAHGAIIRLGDLEVEAPPLVDRLAPEHLELAVRDPRAMAGRIRHAGAIFLGRHTPEALGDYIAGPNHVLPTSRTARFASGLGVLDFLKRTSLVDCDAGGFAALAPKAAVLARSEGLQAHALSLEIRLNRRES